MSKFRKLFSKLKKSKSQDETDQDFMEEEHEVEYLDDSEHEAYEAEDTTGEIALSSENEEKEHFVQEEEQEQEVYDTEEYTAEVHLKGGTGTSEIDLLSHKLSLKDKVEHATKRIKDKVNRFNTRKFKNYSFKDKKLLPPTSGTTAKAKFNWSNIHNDLFLPKNKTPINKAFLVSSSFLGIYIIGKTTGLFLTGTPNYKDKNKISDLNLDKSRVLTASKANSLKDSKLFKTGNSEKVAITKKEVQSDLQCTKADTKSRLPIKLVNTIVIQDSVKSIASVQVRSSKLKELREGDKIGTYAKIDKIERLRIIVKNLQNGSCESIENSKVSSYKKSPVKVLSKRASQEYKNAKPAIDGIENNGDDFAIDRAFLKTKMRNISDILTQAKGIQLTQPDGSMHFKIVNIEPGSIYSYLGIKDGDVITKINGDKITDLNAVMNLFGKITNLDKLGLTIKRGGTNVSQKYRFK